MATQALLKSLCYDSRGQDTVQQTKAGLPYYDGNPYDFEQWHFVVLGKYDAYARKRDKEAREQDRIELSVKVIKGLKDDALKCAMDLGRDVVEDCGSDQSFLGWQARDCNEKTLPRGRKEGQSLGTCARREHGFLLVAPPWYRSLTTLDKTFSIPEHLQLEMMMDCAGITDHQQQLARLTKPLTLETMSLALVQEYPLIHEKELSRDRERPHPVRKPLPYTENLGILTRKERKMVDGGLERLVRHDETLWSSIRGS